MSFVVGPLVLAAAVLGLGGCGARGNSLGTTSSACFHAIPPAETSVGHHGKLIGVRLVKPSGAMLQRVPQLRVAADVKVCLVVFEGSFTPTSVAFPLDQSTGSYVIVVCPPDGSRVLVSIVLDRLPLGFSHSHSL